MSEENPPPALPPSSPLGAVPPTASAKPIHASDMIYARAAAAATQSAAGEIPASSNLVLGIVGGIAAAVAGAVIWAAIAVMANLEVGYVAVGLAFLVGLAVRKLGRGHDTAYGVVGAACSFFGIVLGKVFTLVWLVADKEQISVFSVISQMDWGLAFKAIGDSLNAIDFLFGFFALMLGFKYSMRKD